MAIVGSQVINPRAQRSFTGVSSASSPVINSVGVARSNNSSNNFTSPSNVYELSKNIQKNNNYTAFDIAQKIYQQNLSNAERLNRSQERNFERQLKYNLQNWQNARDYDEYMSSTQYQRAVKDLKKAGLNPILSTRLGGATYHGVGSFASSNILPYYNVATNYMPQLDFNNYLGSAVQYANQDKMLGSYLGSSAISGVLSLVSHLVSALIFKLPFSFFV